MASTRCSAKGRSPRCRNPEQLHAGDHIRGQRVDLRLGGVRLVDLPEARQVGAGGSDVGDVEQHFPRRFVLNVEVPCLRVRRRQLRLGDGEDRETQKFQMIAATRRGNVIVGQKRRIQHHVSGNISENRIVENAISCANHGC